MLKEIFSGLIADIESEFPSIKKVDRYKAELEDISEWKATDTACFLHVMGFKPIAKGAGGKSLKWNLILKVYAGANLKHSKSALEITEGLLKYFDGTFITFTVGAVPFQLKSQVLDEGMEFLLYRTAFESYSFLVSLHTDIAQDVPVMPDEVVLVSPANGYNQGIANNADFQWQTAVGADTYRFQIATDQTFTNVVYDQDRLRYIKLTVPEGMLQNDVQYYWRVSGKNQWGYGDWSEVRSFKTIAVEYEAESIALFNRMTIQPDATRKDLINTLIKNLKTTNIWSKLDCFWMFACHTNTNGEALLNWIKNAHNALMVNNPTFTFDRGIKGNGTTSYLDSNYNPVTQAVNYLLNNASVGIYSRNHDTSGYDLGNVNINIIGLAMNYGTNSVFSLNDTAQVSAGYSDVKGLFIMTRLAPNLINRYDKGAFVTNYSKTSVAIPAGNIFICARNNGAGVASAFSTRQYTCAFIGAGLTSTEVSNINFYINDFLEAIGARV